MIAHPTPERLHAMLNDRDSMDRITIDADYARNCRRALMYAALEIPRSDQEPGELRSAMEIRSSLRDPAIAAMARNGWKIESVRNSVSWRDRWTSLDIAPGIRVLGQPDACGAHGEITQWRTVPIMSSSGPRPDDLYEITNTAAIHSLNPHLERSKDPPEAGPDGVTTVVADLDPNTGRLHLKKMKPGFVEQMLGITRRRMNELSEHLRALREDEEVHPPPRDAKKDSADCRACPWRTACWQGE